MQLSETLYFVGDLDAAVEWYVHRLGFAVLERADWGFVLLEPPGQGRLALVAAAAWNADWRTGDPLPAPLLSFRSNDIDNDVIALATAGVTVGPLQGDEGAVRACWFADPEGNLFYLWTDAAVAP